MLTSTFEGNLTQTVERLRSLAKDPGRDPSLPPCPLCGAPAIRGYRFARPWDIAHDCECQLKEEEAYIQGLHRAWKAHWYPRWFRESLPPAYQGYLETPIRLPQAWAGWEALMGFRKGGVGILYLHGPAGSGKTHLAVRLAWEEAQRGRRALFLLASSLHREEVPKGVELLVLDSLEEAWPEGRTGAQLHELVGRAVRGEMGLILTSLLPPGKALARLGAEGLVRRTGPGTAMPGG